MTEEIWRMVFSSVGGTFSFFLPSDKIRIFSWLCVLYKRQNVLFLGLVSSLSYKWIIVETFSAVVKAKTNDCSQLLSYPKAHHRVTTVFVGRVDVLSCLVMLFFVLLLLFDLFTKNSYPAVLFRCADLGRRNKKKNTTEILGPTQNRFLTKY